MRVPALIAFCVFYASAQRVDLRQTYERIYVVVPFTGAGTKADPKRPQYAPAPPKRGEKRDRAGIIGWGCVASDDGKTALCEFVATERAAFAAILADKNVKSFIKGKHKKAEIEAELKKANKNFDLDALIVRAL